MRSATREPASIPHKNPTRGGVFMWCKIVDAFQTAAIDARDDYKLKHLVEVFKLSGDLI